jgi:hypothetical protein
MDVGKGTAGAVGEDDDEWEREATTTPAVTPATPTSATATTRAINRRRLKGSPGDPTRRPHPNQAPRRVPNRQRHPNQAPLRVPNRQRHQNQAPRRVPNRLRHPNQGPP